MMNNAHYEEAEYLTFCLKNPEDWVDRCTCFSGDNLFPFPGSLRQLIALLLVAFPLAHFGWCQYGLAQIDWPKIDNLKINGFSRFFCTMYIACISRFRCFNGIVDLWLLVFVPIYVNVLSTQSQFYNEEIQSKEIRIR